MFSHFQLSLFEETQRVVGADPPPIRCTKATLMHLAHTLENIVLSRQVPALIFAGFQQPAFWQQAIPRYEGLSRIARQLYVFTGHPLPTSAPPDVTQIALEKDHPLLQEWFVVILSDVFSVLTCAKEQKTAAAANHDGVREFETILSFSPMIINRILDRLELLIENHHPDSLPQLQAGRRRYPVPIATPELTTQVVNEMLAYEEKLIRRVRETESLRREETRLRLELDKERDMNDIRHLMLMTISHEFRTPISMISSSSEMLERYFDTLSEEGRLKRLKTIRAQVQQLHTLLETVDTVLMAGTGQLSFQPERLNPVDLCDGLVSILQDTTLREHTIVFTHRWARGIVKADERLLRLILTHLISNAAKFSPKQLTIDLELTEEAEQMIFRVCDRGIGIPESNRKHIYEAFYRGSNVSSIGGSGLGLKIVYDCVTLHQGKITFTSTDKGTTFTVALPIIMP